MGTAWKDLEKTTAKQINGRRNTRGANFGQSISDVSHDLFSIETKYRARLPILLKKGLEQASTYADDSGKIPLLVIKQKFQKGAYAVLRMRDFCALFGRLPEQGE
jgi:hypothetical protein